MPPLASFVGPTYQAQVPGVDLERCINLYPEMMQVQGKSRSVLFGTPGLQLFTTVPGAVHRGAYAVNGQYWVVSDGTFYEVFANGTFAVRGLVSNDGLPVTISSNGENDATFSTNNFQLFIVSGGNGYLFNILTLVFTNLSLGPLLQTVLAGTPPVPTALGYINQFPLPGNATYGAVFDDYFVVLIGGNPNTQAGSGGFAVSNPNDGLTWNSLGFQIREEGADNFVAMAQNQRALWLFGSATTEVWYDQGVSGTTALNFPFAPIPGVFVQEGIAAKFSLVSGFDNSLIWLGQNSTGGRVFREANGYTAMRISTHGVEAQLDSYSRVDDAIAWAYREGGHEFYVCTFPTAGVTWAYDAATKQWHERAYLDPTTGAMTAVLGVTHAFAFNKHLVGDRRNGNIYQQAIGFFTDNGAPIRSVRRSPYVGTGDNKWMYHHRIELELAAGLGMVATNVPASQVGTEVDEFGNPITVPTPQGVAPVATLRWSNDGHAWSNEYATPIGALGSHETRAIWRRLGRARWRNYEIAVVDPVRRAWMNCYLDATPGTN